MRTSSFQPLVRPSATKGAVKRPWIADGSFWTWPRGCSLPTKLARKNAFGRFTEYQRRAAAATAAYLAAPETITTAREEALAAQAAVFA
jgi:hypothetical protein